MVCATTADHFSYDRIALCCKGSLCCKGALCYKCALCHKSALCYKSAPFLWLSLSLSRGKVGNFSNNFLFVTFFTLFNVVSHKTYAANRCYKMLQSRKISTVNLNPGQFYFKKCHKNVTKGPYAMAGHF